MDKGIAGRTEQTGYKKQNAETVKNSPDSESMYMRSEFGAVIRLCTADGAAHTLPYIFCIGILLVKVIL